MLCYWIWSLRVLIYANFAYMSIECCLYIYYNSFLRPFTFITISYRNLNSYNFVSLISETNTSIFLLSIAFSDYDLSRLFLHSLNSSIACKSCLSSLYFSSSKFSNSAFRAFSWSMDFSSFDFRPSTSFFARVIWVSFYVISPFNYWIVSSDLVFNDVMSASICLIFPFSVSVSLVSCWLAVCSSRSFSSRTICPLIASSSNFSF